MPANLKALLDEILTVDDLLTVVLSTVAASVDLGTHSAVAQALATALAVVSLVGTVANKLKNGRVS